MRASAILLAAGLGTRLGGGTPKAFVNLGSVSLLVRVLQSLAATAAVQEIVVTVPAGTEQRARGQVQAAQIQLPVKIVAGGPERQDSVRVALGLTSAESELVVIHDAARPFATPAMFSACIAAAAANGAAIAAIPVKDTLKRVEGQTIVSTLAREGLWHAQTPQAFRRDLLWRAHEEAFRDSVTATDDACLCERLGIAVQIVPGSATNLKITSPDDLQIGEAIAASFK
jgi:2-C-methyl-D-erythritol 4-phosphate cytidylyltransferase